MQCYAEQRGQGIYLQPGADDAQPTDDSRSTRADVGLAGNVVKVNPAFACAVGGCHNALGAQNGAVLALITQGGQHTFQRRAVKADGRLGAAAYEHLVGIVILVTGDWPVDLIVWIIFSIVYQQVENNVIQPQIQNRAVEIQPFFVLVSVLFASTLFGVLGALLAIGALAIAGLIVAAGQTGSDDEGPTWSAWRPAGTAASSTRRP